MNSTHTIEEVFGVGRDIPLNYVTRDNVDTVFEKNLSRDRHIVLHGSSKTGKSCLRQQCMKEIDALNIHCLSNWSISSLSEAILKAAGYETKRSESQTISGGWKIFAKAKASFLGSGVEGGAETKREKATTVTTEPIEIDPSDVNDLISALNAASAPRIITLEDFHYLSEEVQREFSVFLKALHEKSKYVLVIVGVWLEDDRLSHFNGDLTGRIASITADKWDETSLRALVTNSEQLLNIKFDQNFCDELIAFCMGTVYVAQEVLYQACLNHGVQESAKGARLEGIGNGQDAVDMAKQLIDQSTGRFNGFMTVFADGFQDTKLEMHRYILGAVIQSSYEDVSRGLRMREIKSWINENHPSSPVNTGNITQALQSMAALQVKKNQKPIILDYDASALRLHVVDKSFSLWLEYQNKEELLELLDIELPKT